jgi:hypothetical protein
MLEEVLGICEGSFKGVFSEWFFGNCSRKINGRIC